MSAPWYRKPLCWIGLCETFQTKSNDDGVWGECWICHRRAGYVDRETLRRACDADAATRTPANAVTSQRAQYAYISFDPNTAGTPVTAVGAWPYRHDSLAVVDARETAR